MLVPMERSCHKEYIHVKYESSTYSSSRVIGKVKVFVHADVHVDAGGTTIALRTYVPAN